jgi:hypothetical protein
MATGNRAEGQIRIQNVLFCAVGAYVLCGIGSPLVYVRESLLSASLLERRDRRGSRGAGGSRGSARRITRSNPHRPVPETMGVSAVRSTKVPSVLLYSLHSTSKIQ